MQTRIAVVVFAVVVATVPAAAQAPFTCSWTDNPIVAGQTPIKAEHLNEIRACLDSIIANWPAPTTVPADVADWAGMRMLAPVGGTCPAGWSEDTSLRGRYVVGTPENGTPGGTSGAPLTNLEVRRGGSAGGLDPGVLPTAAFSPGLLPHHPNPLRMMLTSDGNGWSTVRTDEVEDGAVPVQIASGPVAIHADAWHSNGFPSTLAFSSGALPSYADQPQPAPYSQETWCKLDP